VITAVVTDASLSLKSRKTAFAVRIYKCQIYGSIGEANGTVDYPAMMLTARQVATRAIGQTTK